MKKKTKKIVATPKVPKTLKPFVIRKFRSTDRRKRILVVRLPKEEGFNVQTVAKRGATVVLIRSFAVPMNTEIPVPVLWETQRELATWYARHVAKHGTPPPVKKERGRRRRFMKRSLARFQEHLATKQMVRVLRKEAKAAPKPKLLSVVMPWICIYDPKQSVGDTTFRIHTAYCSRLDFERRKAIRDRGGDSWVIESKTADDAVALQLEEFVADDMGYDATDFEIHNCERE